MSMDRIGRGTEKHGEIQTAVKDFPNCDKIFLLHIRRASGDRRY